jgi:hypothetical protein
VDGHFRNVTGARSTSEGEEVETVYLFVAIGEGGFKG